MLRTITRLTPTAFIPIFQNTNIHDVDNINKQNPGSPKTGWERVRTMYSRNEYDEFKEEISMIAQSSLCGAFFGACMGGTVMSRNAYLYFIENNQATIFRSTMEAKKKLQDYVLVAFAKGAYQWGWRLGTFTCLFSTIATTISVYRGESSLAEYIMAGTLTGGAFRVHLGLAATIVGAGLGAALSTIAGALILGILKATGFSMDEIRGALYKLKEHRENQYRQAEEKASEIKHDKLTDFHTALVQERGAKKIEDL